MVMPSASSSTHNGSALSGMPNPEVVEKAQRRLYTAEYKLECSRRPIPVAKDKSSKQEPKPKPTLNPKPALALSDEERQQVLEILHNERFVEQSSQEVYATLLDKGIFLCSIRTMYRILADHAEVRERRNQLRHPNLPG